MRIPAFAPVRWSTNANNDVYRLARNVGIGTSTPDDFKLQVAGDIGPDADLGSDLGSAIKRYGSVFAGPSSYHLVSKAPETSIGRDWQLGIRTTGGLGQGNFHILENISAFLDITPAGYVGVGTLDPQAKLHVDGNIIAAAPTDDAHVTTKSYVDSVVQGISWQDPVLSKAVSDPGTLTPVAGDRYIVKAPAVGDWAGKEEQIAEYEAAAWAFYEPGEGWAVWVEDEDLLYTYNDDFPAGSWVKFSSMVSHSSLANLNVQADHPSYVTLDGTRVMTGFLKWGTTSSDPALKRSAAELHIRLANDSDFATLRARDGIFTSSIRLGTTTDTTAGNVRWTGSDFQGYTGSAWVALGHHALGSSAHTSDTLANLSLKVSDADLIASADSRLSDDRISVIHGLGDTLRHSSATLTQVNALVSDATLVDTGDARFSDDRISVIHGLGDTLRHSSATLTQVNALVSDANLIASTDSRLSDDRTASGLRTDTTVVGISGATAPTIGQALVATSSTDATWQNVTSPPGGATTQVQINDGGSFYGDSGFVYNKTTGDVGIGVAPSSNALHIQRNGALTGAFVSMDTYSNDIGYPSIISFRKSSTNSVANSATSTNDWLGILRFQGNNGSGFTNGAAIEAQQTAAAGTYSPTKLVFKTSNGTSDWAEAMTIDASQQVGIGTGSPDTKLAIANGTTHTLASISTHSTSTTGAQSQLWFRKTNNNTVGSFGTTVTGESLGAIAFLGSNASAFKFGGDLQFVQEGTVSTYTPTYFRVRTSNGTTVSEALRIDSSQRVGIGNFSSGTAVASKLHVLETGTTNPVIRLEQTNTGTSAAASYRAVNDSSVQFQFGVFGSNNTSTIDGIAAADAVVVGTIGTASKMFISMNADGPMHFLTNGSTAMTIDSAQDVQFTKGIRLGTTANTTAGNVRYNGTNFQGYHGAAWVNLDTQGGSTSPAGGNTAIQYNDNGSFGADDEFTYNATANRLMLRPTSGDCIFQISPTTAASKGYLGFEGNLASNRWAIGVDPSLDGLRFRSGSLLGSADSKMHLTANGHLLIGSGSTALSFLDVDGNCAIGGAYAALFAAPTDGLIVEGNVGIGTPQPTAGITLDIQRAAGNAAVFLTSFSTADTHNSIIRLMKSSASTRPTNGATVTGEYLGQLQFMGNSGSGFTFASEIRTVQNGAASTMTPADMLFYTSDGSTLNEAMRIDSSKNVGIGTTSVDGALNIVRAGAATRTTVNYDTYSDDSGYGTIINLRKSDSNTVAHNATEPGNKLGEIIFQGNTGSAFAGGGWIQGWADTGTITTNVPGYLRFQTATGSSTVSAMWIDSSQRVGIGAKPAAASALLELTSTTGSLLIPRMTTIQKNALTAAAGMMVYDTDLGAFHGYTTSWAGLGGGGTPGGSSTQVQINDGGAFYGDANFTYDKATGYVSIGAPDNANKTLNVRGLGAFRDDSDQVGISLISHAGSVEPASTLWLFGSRGTYAAPTNVVDNDLIGMIYFGASTGTQWSQTTIRVEADATPTTTTDAPTRMIFSTAPVGSRNAVEALRIDHDGNVGVGRYATHSAPVAGPFHLLRVNESPGSVFYLDTYKADNTQYSQLSLRKSDSNTYAHGETDDGDILGLISFQGNSGSAFLSSGQIRVTQEGAASGGRPPAKMDFYTAAVGGSHNLAMTIDSAQNVGIGLAPIAGFPLTVGGDGLFRDDTAENTLSLQSFSASAAPATSLRVWGSRGTIASPSSVVDNDLIGELQYLARTGSSWSKTEIRVEADATPTSSVDAPTRMIFATAPVGDRASVEAMRIDSGQDVQFAQKVGIGGVPHATYGLAVYGQSGLLAVADSTPAVSSLLAYSGGATSPDNSLAFWSARGPGTAATALVNGDRICHIHNKMWSQSWDAFSPIETYVDAAPSSGVVPTRLVFNTNDASGNEQEAMRIDSSQKVTMAKGLAAWGVTAPGSQPSKISDPTDLASALTAIAALIDVIEGAGLAASS